MHGPVLISSVVSALVKHFFILTDNLLLVGVEFRNHRLNPSYCDLARNESTCMPNGTRT